MTKNTFDNIFDCLFPLLTMELSLPVNRIRPTIDKNT